MEAKAWKEVTWKTMNDVFIENTEQQLIKNGLTIGCIRGLAEYGRGHEELLLATHKSCIIRS